jgi:hypothetical protein
MTNLDRIGGLVPETTDEPQINWGEFVDSYSAQLQLERNSEGEGWTANHESLIFDRVFTHTPDQAASLYAALFASQDPNVRISALAGLTKLAEVDPDAASDHLAALLEDDVLEVRAAAFEHEDL